MLNKANGSAGGICLSGWQIRLAKIFLRFRKSLYAVVKRKIMFDKKNGRPKPTKEDNTKQEQYDAAMLNDTMQRNQLQGNDTLHTLQNCKDNQPE